MIRESKRNFESDQFRIAVEAAPNAMIMVDEEGKIVLANRQTEVLFGYSKEELFRNTIEILVPEKYRRQHPVDRSNFWQKPQPRRMGAGRDLYGVRKDGREIPVEIGLTPVEFAGSRYVISSILDITERKEAESRIREKTEELARSNADLEQFAYVASHDLQAPLRHVTAYVQLLEEKLKGKLDAQTMQWFEFVAAGAKRMNTLINGLLAFSRVSRVGSAFSEVDTGAVAQEALKNLTAAVRESDALVSVEKLPVIRGDSARLLHLFQNLMQNAMKFQPKGRRPEVRISSQERGMNWLFSVSDNGIGIEEQFRNRLFIIFQRLHTADEYVGVGLGLAICKRIVDYHGGEIWFESLLGQGTTFYFTIPKKGAKA